MLVLTAVDLMWNFGNEFVHVINGVNIYER